MFSIDFEPAWVLELESDAQDKFSRHVIIQIPGKAFANNLHAGHFVREVCKAAIHPETGVSSLQVAKVTAAAKLACLSAQGTASLIGYT